MTDTDRGDLEIFETPDQLAHGVANHFMNAALSAQTERGGFYVALAGGSTPKAAYELLATEPYATRVPWKDVFIYFSDERPVGPDDIDSNYGMAKRAFLDAVNIPSHNIHRIHGEDDPQHAAETYARILTDDLGALPRFDLIMLGMGPDGHTASLFPGGDPGIEDGAIVDAPYVEKLREHRITLTARTINNAREVLIETQGPGKAPALAAVLKGPRNPGLYPVQLVQPTDGRLFWMVDSAAASSLQS